MELNDYDGIAKKLDNCVVVVLLLHRSVDNLIVGLPQQWRKWL